MQQDLIELIKILGNLPGAALWGIGIFFSYKAIIYLATTGSIIYCSKEICKVFRDYFNNRIELQRNNIIELERKHETVYYHGLIKVNSNKNAEWFYNRRSLSELALEGQIERFYCTKNKEVTYPG